MPDEQVVQPQTDQKPLDIEVSPEVAFNLRLQEFDKNIAMAEAQAANLKMQKASFVYDRNIQTLIEADKAKKEKVVKDEAIEVK
jgi:hypothetical protein